MNSIQKIDAFSKPTSSFFDKVRRDVKARADQLAKTAFENRDTEHEDSPQTLRSRKLISPHPFPSYNPKNLQLTTTTIHMF